MSLNAAAMGTTEGSTAQQTKQLKTPLKTEDNEATREASWNVRAMVPLVTFLIRNFLMIYFQ